MLAPDLISVLHQDRGRLLSALTAWCGDSDLAEDALSAAVEVALTQSKPPQNPQGWLLQVARRKAIDELRRRVRFRARQRDIALLGQLEETPEPQDIPDARLRMIFICCHPALGEKTRVALTLRSLCGLSTDQVAAMFLDAPTTMGQRLTRARRKITHAGIPFTVPELADWPARYSSVLTVIYLIFTTGYAGDVDHCEEAIFLARMMCDLCPDEAEGQGLLALFLLTHARRNARHQDGQFVPLHMQDRAHWDGAMIKEGLTLLDHAVARLSPGAFQIKAAIAALHVQGDEGAPDWRQILLLYDRLLDFEATPVVHLNRAVALAEVGWPARALALLTGLENDLQNYQPYYAACAEIHIRLGNKTLAKQAYQRAILLSDDKGERDYLRKRLKNCN